MSHRNLKFPEPTLPEHALIRDCAPTPQLSAGFKSRVMAECTASITTAQRTLRLKVAGGIAAVCCLSLLVCLTVQSDSEPGGPIVEQPVERELDVSPSRSHSRSYSPSSGSQGLAVDSARPLVGGDPEKSQMNDIIEKLNDRQKMFHSDMLPKF